jgi:hypothetical protein
MSNYLFLSMQRTPKQQAIYEAIKQGVPKADTAKNNHASYSRGDPTTVFGGVVCESPAANYLPLNAYFFDFLPAL